MLGHSASEVRLLAAGYSSRPTISVGCVSSERLWQSQTTGMLRAAALLDAWCTVIAWHLLQHTQQQLERVAKDGKKMGDGREWKMWALVGQHH